ncbi:hypothetical protein [Thermovibrio ammonificans]|uniref:Restriction endonuclease type IV Mrr domain-containing protein n=1 Tax=Thermovibrio ammonificans (strain DSM 15698 / JCM 12110 / HB-1) TaxID=648996 RepID=E8T3G1_THEA1|nr:hypothetical protein [Thermovibrio ammonificans]ADU96092.1 hypothetical protein Theam_0118 [Thermovibrio ammonificans HB-1]
MEHGLSKEELVEIMAILMEEEGFEVYEPQAEGEEYLPDFIAVFEGEDGEVQQVAVQVEDCRSLETEEARKRAQAIADHCRRSGEGYIFVVPIECEDLGKEKFEEWKLSDVAEFVPIGIEFEEEQE